VSWLTTNRDGERGSVACRRPDDRSAACSDAVSGGLPAEQLPVPPLTG